MPNMDVTNSFLDGTLAALSYAEGKHDSFPTDRIHASAILNEEAGKLTQVCIDAEYGRLSPEEAQAKMEKFAFRVGAMALRFYSGLPVKPGE